MVMKHNFIYFSPSPQARNQSLYIVLPDITAKISGIRDRTVETLFKTLWTEDPDWLYCSSSSSSSSRVASGGLSRPPRQDGGRSAAPREAPARRPAPPLNP